jgi:hypothetical protein
MNSRLTVTRRFHVVHRRSGRKQLEPGAAANVATGRIPRIARLMALAIRCNQLIHDGAVADQSELAGIGHVTTARVTQIMSLLSLAPDIQEQILFLPRTERGRDVVKETDIRPIVAATLDWRKQRRMWLAIQPSLEDTGPGSRQVLSTPQAEPGR